jgi:hypothetical protein
MYSHVVQKFDFRVGAGKKDNEDEMRLRVTALGA